MIRLRALAEKVRGSLFYVPSLFVLASGVLAWAVVRVDAVLLDDTEGSVFLLAATVDSARAILSTIAGATITVAGIVFSVTVVSVQLASSQFSPRVLRGFLRDRLQQTVIGIVVATFTYCMFVLATTRVAGAAGSGADAAPNLAVTVAIALAVVSILAIVAFIDHSARSMQVGHIIRRVTAETRARIAVLYDAERSPEPPAVETAPPAHLEAHVVRAWTDGWVQQLSEDALRTATPPGCYVRVDSGVGAFVVEDTPLVTVWATDAPDLEAVQAAFVLGPERTMQQDVMFGIRQLVDIGLRALSTGVNDPTTAYEVIVHLGAVLSDVLQCELPPQVRRDDDGRVVVMATRHDHAGHVERAFDQLRIAGAAQPAVLIRILRTLHLLDELMIDLGLDDRRAPIRRQAQLVVETAEHAGYITDDLDRIREVAGRLGLLREDDAGGPPRGAAHAR